MHVRRTVIAVTLAMAAPLAAQQQPGPDGRAAERVRDHAVERSGRAGGKPRGAGADGR